MIRSILTIASVLSVCALSACDEDKGIVDSGEAEGETETETETENETETEGDPEYFEPVAIGFEYVGGWDSANDDYLLDYVYNGKEYPSYILVTLAELDYFSATDTATREEYSCEIIAYFTEEPSSTLAAETYDYGSGGGESMSLWSAWEGGLYFDENGLLTENCFSLDPATYTDGMPIELFSGMHFGLGFGEISDSIVSWLDKYYNETNMFGTYIALNHPDGNGGYDFVAYDWGYGSLFEWDADTTEISTDEKGSLIESAIGDPSPQGYIQTGAYWYEDFPNLDLTLLKEGVK
jgi:hypothetical protein